jgi:D-glycero-D-manno-heptose 1,7-bisphosphate phosphatase
MRAAVFLDRDGTVIEQVHHLVDPADVRVMAGVAAAIERLRKGGYACVIVTNQSVIARGHLDEVGLERVHTEMVRQLAAEGAALDGIYFCPESPLQDDPTVIEHPDRKPGPGMLLRASRELGIDLHRSWMIGDAVSDLLAGRNAGCKGSILVQTGYGDRVPVDSTTFDFRAKDLSDAVQYILRNDRGAER